MATRLYDSVEFLADEATIYAYLQTAAETNDNAFYIGCLDKAIRARAINQLADANSNPLVVTKIQATFATTPTPTKELTNAQ